MTTHTAQSYELDIVEAIGNCRKCSKYALLGNNLCVECWDIGVEQTIRALWEQETRKKRRKQNVLQ